MYEPVKLFVCSTPFVLLGSIVLTALFPLFYVTREVYRLLHRGRVSRSRFQAQKWEKQKELANATMKWKGRGFPYYYPDSFAGPLPPPQGSAYLLPPQFVGCEPHAMLISLRTRTSVFSLPSWRLFVPHIVIDGMLAFTKE